MTSFKHELVVPNDDLPFRMFLFEGSEGHYAVEKHWHRSVEIFAVFEGQIDFFIDETLYHLEPGQFVLLNSNELHSILAPDKNRTVVLQIPLSVFESYLSEEHLILFHHNKEEADGELMALIRMMYQHYIEKKRGYDFLVQGFYYHLLYILVTKYQNHDISEEQIQHQRGLDKLSAITSYLKANYQQDISLELLADIFGYSTAYLSRMFQKYAKTGYKTYLQNVRLTYAVRELLNTDEAIGEIAGRHGFPNSKSFSKAFYKKYGMRPSQYRRLKYKCQKSAID